MVSRQWIPYPPILHQWIGDYYAGEVLLNGSLLTGPYGLHREDGGQRTRDPEPDFISFRILLLTYKRFHQQMVA